MFGRRKRRDTDLVGAIREELSAADTRAREALADAITQLDARLSGVLDQQARLQLASTEQSILRMQRSVGNMTAEVAGALGNVADLCALIAERLDSDRAERRVLTDAITRLAPPPSTPLEIPARAIGGTVFASPPISPPAEISIIYDELDFAATTDHAADAVESWWGDDNPWRRPPPTTRTSRVH